MVEGVARKRFLKVFLQIEMRETKREWVRVLEGKRGETKEGIEKREILRERKREKDR